MNQSKNKIDVEKEIYSQQNNLQLNLFSDNLLLNTMDTEIVKPPASLLNQKLCKLSLYYNISHKAMNEIFSIFKYLNNNVSKDVKTLLKTNYPQYN